MRLPTPQETLSASLYMKRMRRDRQCLDQMFKRKGARNGKDKDHEPGSVEAAEGVREFFSGRQEARRNSSGPNSEAPADEAGSIGEADESKGKPMNDPDPLNDNAQNLRKFFDEHASP